MMGIIAVAFVDKIEHRRRHRRSRWAMAAIAIWNVGIQTAAAQNPLTVGFMDKLLGERITWLQWLIAGAPWAVAMSVVLYFPGALPAASRDRSYPWRQGSAKRN
ncbi:anion permease [Cupriavidus basilensis]